MAIPGVMMNQKTSVDIKFHFINSENGTITIAKPTGMIKVANIRFFRSVPILFLKFESAMFLKCTDYNEFNIWVNRPYSSSLCGTEH